MKRTNWITTMMAAPVLMLTASAWASDASTSANASGGRGPGSASASAHYEGDAGFARTDTRTGRVNIARGVALGVDEDGISLSVSTAIAPRLGPALATTFNISIGTNGESAVGTGRVTALGGLVRSAGAAGGARADRDGAAASAAGTGRTAPGGIVKVKTVSRHEPSERHLVARLLRHR